MRMINYENYYDKLLIRNLKNIFVVNSFFNSYVSCINILFSVKGSQGRVMTNLAWFNEKNERFIKSEIKTLISNEK